MAILDVTTSIPSDRDPMDDQIFRNQVQSWYRDDETEKYAHTEIEVEYGPKKDRGPRDKMKIDLRYALDSRYMFVCYADNKPCQAMDRDEYAAVACNALEKYAGVNGLRIQLGPRPEDHNRYNFMVEFDKEIEIQPSTLVKRAEAEAEKVRERDRIAKLRELGLLPAVESLRAHGPYQPRG